MGEYGGVCVGGSYDHRHMTAISPVIRIPKPQGSCDEFETYNYVGLMGQSGFWLIDGLNLEDATRKVLDYYAERK